jgi:hypothetical protein
MARSQSRLTRATKVLHPSTPQMRCYCGRLRMNVPSVVRVKGASCIGREADLDPVDYGFGLEDST